MTELLTARQVQEILKVDRITVYRMLHDGRLKGVKIGQQWRFNRSEVDRLLGAETQAQPSAPEGDGLASSPAGSVFPVHCMQTIQNLFSDVSQISAIVVDLQGSEITQVSRPTALYQAIAGTPTGQQAYHEGWQEFAQKSTDGSRYFTCSGGMQYIGAPVYDGEKQVALFLAGQFYWQAPDPREQAERLRRLSVIHGLPLEALQAAAPSVPVIPAQQHQQVEAWPISVARALQSILSERVRFIDRLQRIASLSQIP